MAGGCDGQALASNVEKHAVCDVADTSYRNWDLDRDNRTFVLQGEVGWRLGWPHQNNKTSQTGAQQ